MMSRYLDDSLETGGKSTIFESNPELVDLETGGEIDSRIKFMSENVPRRDVPSSWDRTVSQRIENLILEQVENLEDKVASASMQVKGWKIPNRSNFENDESNTKRQKIDPIETSKQRLIALESAIERRYLKPPLGFATGEGGIAIQADQDESIPKGKFQLKNYGIPKGVLRGPKLAPSPPSFPRLKIIFNQ